MNIDNLWNNPFKEYTVKLMPMVIYFNIIVYG